MAEEPEVKVADYDGNPIFEIAGKRYELPLKNSELVERLDMNVTEMDPNDFYPREFSIVMPCLFESPDLGKYLEVKLAVHYDIPGSRYECSGFGIESAKLLDNIKDYEYEPETLESVKLKYLEASHKLIQGGGDSYAERINDQWHLHGTNEAAENLPDGVRVYKLNNLAEQFNDLPDDVPVFAIQKAFENQAVAVMQKDSLDFVTKKMVTDRAKNILWRTDFPDTDRNISLIAQELVDDASYSNIKIAHDNLIKGMFKGQNKQLLNSQLDGFYKDPRIDKRKNKVLEADSTARLVSPAGAGQTLNSFLLAMYKLPDGDLNRGLRQLDYKELNNQLEKMGFECLVKRHRKPKFGTVINGQKKVLSEHDVLSRALDAVENRYVQDRTAIFISNYLRDQVNNPIDKRLELAVQVVENAERVKLVKLDPSKSVSKNKSQTKAKER